MSQQRSSQLDLLNTRQELHTEVRLSEVIGALSYVLDITEGQPEGHALRSCLIGMRLATLIHLPESQHSDLFYALLLKDLGCSSNAAKVCALLGANDLIAKRNMKVVDWARLPQAVWYGLRNLAPQAPLHRRALQLVKTGLQAGPFAAKQLFAVRCDRGADIARMAGFTKETAAAIRALDEHWDGHGYPHALKGSEIPLLGRILCLAQTVDVFFRTYGLEAACAVAEQRRGTWFDPELVAALQSLKTEQKFWRSLATGDIASLVAAQEPRNQIIFADETRLDLLAKAFAQVIDAKSPWTYRHSEAVAETAVGIAHVLDFSADELQTLWRAALLHDIGKLGISNHILDKKAPRTAAENAQMRRHPSYTRQLLQRVSCFRHFADLASSHHERLDGSGYDRGLRGEQLSAAARALAVADWYETLTTDGPYRVGVTPEQAMAQLRNDGGKRLCTTSVGALQEWLDRTPAR